MRLSVLCALIGCCCAGCGFQWGQAGVNGTFSWLTDIPAQPNVTVEKHEPSEAWWRQPEWKRDSDEGPALVVRHTGSGSAELRFSHPKPDQPAKSAYWPIKSKYITYTVRMKLENVQGTVAPALLLVYPDGREVFHRGEEAAGEGETGYQTFEMRIRVDKRDLPSNFLPGLYIEGPGTVWLDDYQVTYYAAVPLGDMLAAQGIAISVVMGCAALLYGWWMWRGLNRELLLASQWTLLLLALVITCAGGAMAALQWIHLYWFPFVVSGGCSALLLTVMMVVARKRYRRLESQGAPVADGR